MGLLFFLSRAAQEEDDTQFKALEVLVLDDNKLSSGVFNSLKNLKRSSCGLKFAIENKVLLKAHLQCIKKKSVEMFIKHFRLSIPG